jgi:hypothetical protein
MSSRDATLVENCAASDPMRPLLWGSKSHDKVTVVLQKKDHEISASSLKRPLPTLGCSRQPNRKADEGSKHPDLEHINAKAIAAQTAGQAVISVDTKKKELIGNHENGGTDYRPKAIRGASRCTTSRTRSSARSLARRDHKRGSVCRRLDPPLARRDGARAEAPMERVSGWGRSSCKSSPTRRASCSATLADLPRATARQSHGCG